MNTEQKQQIEMLYLEMFKKLKAYAKCSLGSDALAEEAVQETFRIACQKPDALCGSANPEGWLVLTLKNTIFTIRSHQAAVKRIVEQYLVTQSKEVCISEDRIDLKVLYEDVADTEDFKLLFEMAVDGKSHKEMAEARGITVANCKKRLQRAKERLQKKIEV